MHPVRVAPAERVARPNGSAHELLVRLQAAHHELLTCIRLMEGLTSSRSPDVEQLTAARFKISHASHARRTVWYSVRELLQPGASPREAQALRKLTEHDRQLFGQSLSHVSSWTVPAILADWKGYQAASRSIRAGMIESVKMERSLLYPMLSRVP